MGVGVAATEAAAAVAVQVAAAAAGTLDQILNFGGKSASPHFPNIYVND